MRFLGNDLDRAEAEGSCYSTFEAFAGLHFVLKEKHP